MDLFPTLHKSLYLRIRWIRWCITASVCVNLCLWAYVYWRVEPRVNPVPLHISAYFGIDYTAPYWYYYLFPLIGLMITVAHVVIGRFFYRSSPVLTLMLLTTSALVQGVAFGVVVLITKYLD